MDYSRTAMLVGEDGIERLRSAKVAIYGLGGVGGYALESLARAGVGSLYIYDYDRIMPSNSNRQILALDSTMDRTKTEVAITRIRDINPGIDIHFSEERITPENVQSMVPDQVTHAVDAIDEVNSKVALILTLFERGAVFISSMGAGNRTDPTQIKTADISVTQGCPLARTVRKKLREKGITSGVRCVYSTEPPFRIIENEIPGDNTMKKSIGSISYMPAIFGLYAAGFIIRDILEIS